MSSNLKDWLLSQTDYKMDMVTYILIGVLILASVYFLVLVGTIRKIQSDRAALQKEARLASYLAAFAGTDTEGKKKEEVSASVETTRFYASDGKEIDASLYDQFVASGNSMILCGIHDKDLLFVEKGFDVSRLVDLPKVVMIKRRDAQPDEIQYKIRRTWKVCRITDNLPLVLDEIMNLLAFRKLQETVACPAKEVLTEDFFDVRIKKYKEYYPDCDSEHSEFHQIIISTTLHTDINEVRFSVHPVKDIKGVVAYSFTIPLSSLKSK